MKIIGITILFLLSCIKSTHGLTCWFCENVKDGSECLHQGRIQKCQSNEDVCESKVRRGSYGILLWKSCKQPHACQNDVKQNPKAAWYPTQCNSRVPSSVCRCCCKSDLCNLNYVGCKHNKTLIELEIIAEAKTTTATPQMTNTLFSTISNPDLLTLADPSFSSSVCLLPKVPNKGHVRCNGNVPNETDQYVIGTTCDYTCDKGFHMSGPTRTTCTANKGFARPSFKPLPPTCQSSTSCVLPAVSEKIRISCDSDSLPNGQYRFGSPCQFTCNDEESDPVDMAMLCQYHWDYVSENMYLQFFPLPTVACEARKYGRTCKKLDAVLNGKTTCSYSNYVGSTCTFSCDEGYQIYPPFRVSTRCRAGQYWDNKSPCCLPNCPPNAFMDLVIVLDSSSSIDEKSWELMLNFSSNLINQFNFADNGTRVGLFRYNVQVDKRHQILLNSYQSKTQVLKAISKLSFNNGNGTFTGKAFRYVREVMFTPQNGDRPDAPNVLVVITDGNTADGSLLTNETKKLQSNRVTTYAVGVVSNSTEVNSKQLFSISANKNIVVYLQQDSVYANKYLHLLMGKSMCKTQKCSYNKNQTLKNN